ncbi:MAG: prepilin-type N-terminal cleavage/methylation domain-containing protein [Bdellovibrionaceae bacterium]|nr:prepilin-type N-terminal cleavage/methylation domain-containing protein [Pseudobdellovibrionaceae bacterium]
MSSIFNNKGLTLIEVLIAVAILVGGVVVISSSWSGTLLKIRKAKIYNEVHYLLQKKMAEIEIQYKSTPINEIPEEISGTFLKPYGKYKWQVKSQNMSLPNLKSLIENQNSSEQSQNILSAALSQLQKAVKEVQVTVILPNKKNTLSYHLATYFVDYHAASKIGGF